MTISIIAAVSQNNVIGKDSKLPWHLPADMAHFKDTTSNHCVVMGQTTFESIGRPLPNRTNIVMTLNKNFTAKGVKIAYSPEEALELAEQTGEQEVFIIGGATIYKLFLSKADRIYLTKIKKDFEGDTFFPKINMAEWKEVSKEKHKADEKNLYYYEFLILERK